MTARGPKRNNVLAGLFLVATLTIAVVLSFWVSDLTDRLGRFADYAVEFSLKDGAAGIEPGSPVLLGGKAVGRVDAVGWTRGPAAPDGRTLPTGIRVDIKIRRDIPLYSNAVTQVERPILGGLAAINIVSPGGTGPSFPTDPPPTLLAEGDTVRGTLAPGLLAQAGLGAQEIESFKSIIRQIDSATADIAHITSVIAPDTEFAVENLVAMLAAARRAVASAEADYTERWSPRVTAALENVDAISATGVDIADSARLGVDEARAGIEEARGIITSTQDILDQARPDIDAILANIEETARHFNEVTTADIDELMSGAKGTLAEYQQLGAKTNLFFDEQEPQIEESLNNVRLASMDARFFINELRAQPQRLLRPPNKKELERELLYSAARAYAAAASDLRAASSALDNVLARAAAGDSSAVSPADIAALQQKLHDAFAQYQSAETTLLDAIIREAPEP